jgi:hypothetical protein
LDVTAAKNLKASGFFQRPENRDVLPMALFHN